MRMADRTLNRDTPENGNGTRVGSPAEGATDLRLWQLPQAMQGRPKHQAVLPRPDSKQLSSLPKGYYTS